jgi:hypothetical protein
MMTMQVKKLNNKIQNMYFATDQVAADFVEELNKAYVKAAAVDPNLSLVALIDSSFEFAKGGRDMPDWQAQATSLYEGTEHSGLTIASPCLLQLPSNGDELRSAISKLVDACSGCPMLSFIATSCCFDDLFNSLKHFIDVGTDDGQSFLLRFADVRILPALDAVLCKERTIGWREGIVHWWVPGRTGTLQALPTYEPNKRQANVPGGSLNLPALPFNMLIDAGECDAILDAIFDQNPDLLTQTNPSEVYFLIQRLKIKIDEFSIANFADSVMFCTTALATNEYFYQQFEFEKLLKSRAWESGKLGGAFSALSDESWEAISLNSTSDV